MDDLSFFESIGLYWVNAADRTNDNPPDVGSENQDQEIVGNSIAVTEEKKNKNIESELDEFDFLNELGLTPVTVGSSRRQEESITSQSTMNYDIMYYNIIYYDIYVI